jgi:hypothetical protein
MIMSKHVTIDSAFNIGIGEQRVVKSAIADTMAAIGKPRELHARRVVRNVVSGISVERLLAYGWTTEDIRRFRSM